MNDEESTSLGQLQPPKKVGRFEREAKAKEIDDNLMRQRQEKLAI